jgi:hypothetical protein
MVLVQAIAHPARQAARIASPGAGEKGRVILLKLSVLLMYLSVLHGSCYAKYAATFLKKRLPPQ